MKNLMFLILFAIVNVSFGQHAKQNAVCPVISDIKTSCAIKGRVVIKFKVKPLNTLAGLTYQIKNSAGSVVGLPTGILAPTAPNSLFLNACNGMLSGQDYTLVIKNGSTIVASSSFIYQPPALCACETVQGSSNTPKEQ